MDLAINPDSGSKVSSSLILKASTETDAWALVGVTIIPIVLTIVGSNVPEVTPRCRMSFG
jgi:hypothetical protein